MAISSLTETAAALAAKLSRKRATTKLVIALERLWIAVLPLAGIAAIYVALSWFGYFRAVPDLVRIATLVVLGLAGLASLYLLTRFRLPSTGESDARLEERNAIAHQAVRVQSDTLERDNPLARALWEEHQRHMSAKLDKLSVGLPNPDTPRRDPYGMRALVVLLLFTAFAFSSSNRAGTLSDAFVSHAVSNAPPTRIDAWITPPAYTGRPPIFLSTAQLGEGAVITLPERSEVVVRISGGAGGEIVSFAAEQAESAVILAPTEANDAPTLAAQRTAAASSGDARGYRMDAMRSGTLVVSGARDGDRAWRLAVEPDQAPEITFAEDPRRAVNGALEIAFSASDDYGIVRAFADIAPVDPAEGARPLYEAPEYRLNLSRRQGLEQRGRASHDLTQHPWSGTLVDVTLVAVDASGQEGRSEPHRMRLPERSFSEPLARALVEQRQILALDANAVAEVLTLSDALMIAPEETIPNLSHFLLLQSARSRIEQAYNDDMLRDSADYLWEVALGIEDGDLSLAERRLRDAQRELAEALENGATDEEIQALMDELREAMQEYLQALAQELQNSDQAMQLPENAMQNLLRQEDLNAMLDQIENLARQGATEEAQQMLSELQRMMNNLQAGRQQQQQQGNGEMRRQMDELGELMREQQELMNETFRLDQELAERMQQSLDPFNPGQQDQQQGNQAPQEGQQGENGLSEMTPEQLQEALRQLRAQQEALQQQLGELQESLEGMGMEPSEGFGQAGEAMGDASRSLGDGRGEQAVGEQGRALEALRQGAQDMMNQMMQQMGQGEGQGEGQGQNQMRRSDTDPLGRPRSTEGPDFGDTVRVPDEIDIQRAREILEAIRNRLGNALSPQLERQYLERLLEMR